MHARDLGESESTSGNAGIVNSPFETTEAVRREHVAPGFRRNDPPTHLATSSYFPFAQNQPDNISAQAQVNEESVPASHFRSADYGRREMCQLIDGVRTPIFGDLPDPIQLSEQVGDFDGQVVFIGHPNKDISAHQWSASSFQWINIGRYSSFHGKVEGSLASDRLRGLNDTHDTLQRFKLAAESRQALIVENERAKDKTVVIDHEPSSRADDVVTIHTKKATPAKDFRHAAQGHNRKEIFPPLPSHGLSRLEDPFITPNDIRSLNFSNSKHGSDNWMDSTGFLDLTYRFPTQATTADMSTVARPAGSPYKSLQIGAPAVLSRQEQEHASGDEAATYTRERSIQRVPMGTGYQRLRRQSQFSDNTEGSRLTSVRRSNVGLTADVLEDGYASRNADRSGPTMHDIYNKSALNAAAAPFAKVKVEVADPKAQVLVPGAITAATAGLHYSDPDGFRTAQRHEVVNGLARQPPTPQNFRGPFFTDSKPTTDDPTIALSVRDSEKEELANWFRDGHRPTRQKEYAKSLMAAAEASDRHRRLGAIGERYTKPESSAYANTAPFVRLYENLSEYAEECRSGGQRSYFTRHWAPPVPQAQETGHDNSTGYSSRGGMLPRWSKPPGFMPPGRSMWG